MKSKGKPKTPPSTEERSTITTMTAAGASISAIAKTIGRSRHMVRDVLAEPEVKTAIQDEKAELAERYKDMARKVLVSIDDATIQKAGLKDRALSSGIFIDKSLALTGESPISLSQIPLLMEICEAIRHGRDERIAKPVIEGRLPAELP